MKYYLILLLSLLLFLPGFSQDQLNQMNYGYFDKNDLSFIPIGEAANAYSYAGNPKTSLWADDKINSVSFVHRMVFEYNTGDATGRIAYDVSLQMGASGSWTSNTQVYDPVINPNAWQHRSSRYPQGAIYNPFGNEDPENAYFTYFSPVFTYDNDFYGDYAFGINQLSETNPPNPSRNYTDDIDSIYRCVPSAFTITQDGFSWAADKNFDIINQEYQESLILNKGTFNDSLEDFEYEEYLLPFLSENDTITASKNRFRSQRPNRIYLCPCSTWG
ncbi:MAG: hypothetical protein U5Q03_14750 [Bacteroidota bacterium]|nr:hypothetical protein [Bacteroidota bacterium]